MDGIPSFRNQVTITFDKVLDTTFVQNAERKDGTLFSFRHATGAEYGAFIAGKPRIVSGMTVTAILRVEGDWKNVVAWIDHETGAIACESLWRYVALVAVIPFLLIMAMGFWGRYPLVSVCLLLLVYGVVFASFQKLRYLFRIRRHLTQVGRQLAQIAWARGPQA